MQTQDASNIQHNVLLSPIVGVYWNEMSRLSEPIHDHPNEIILVGRERQTYNEIHANVFPFQSKNVQRLQQSGRPQMIILYTLTHVAFCHIVSSLTLHSSPSEFLFQIMIHLHAARVDGIFGSMSLIKNLISHLMVFWYHKLVFEP
jgi:hypothetical protein